MRVRLLIERVAIEPPFGSFAAPAFRRDLAAALGGGIADWAELGASLGAVGPHRRLPNLSIVMHAASTDHGFATALGIKVRGALRDELADTGPVK